MRASFVVDACQVKTKLVASQPGSAAAEDNLNDTIAGAVRFTRVAKLSELLKKGHAQSMTPTIKDALSHIEKN